MPKQLEITQAVLMSTFLYDCDTGVFTCIKSSRRRRSGKVEKIVSGAGYIQIFLNGKYHSAHRLAWLYYYGRWPDRSIDHINGIKTDNRICNLRDVSSAENSHNAHAPTRRNKFGLRGVTFHKNKYRAQIAVNRKLIYLGSFPTPEEAGAAYVSAKRKLHPSAFLNKAEDNHGR